MPHPLDLSSVARAKRNAQHRRQLRELMLVSVRPRVFVALFLAASVVAVVGAIGAAFGWWS